MIFDLFNEPYITSWSCWLNGCATRYKPGRKRVSYQSAGMQTLVNAVRSAGASQPIMLGGLKYSSDDSQWLDFEPADPNHQLIVGFHTYNFGACNTEACWNSTIAPLAAKLPVITGEMGESGCKHTYIDGYMPWADRHGVSYLGWAWDSTSPPSGWQCSGGPALIKNYDGTPTAFGAGLKEPSREARPAPSGAFGRPCAVIAERRLTLSGLVRGLRCPSVRRPCPRPRSPARRARLPSEACRRGRPRRPRAPGHETARQ